MKLGIFGDSYASHGDYDTSWPNFLNLSLGCEEARNYACPGTSHWFSYKRFIAKEQKKNSIIGYIENYQYYDTIVFCHTNSMRWPEMPSGEHGRAWNIGYRSDPVVDKYNKIRQDIMSEQLLNYISFNIFRDINRLCLENNIYLVNILCFPLDFILPPTKFPVLINLSQISRKEQVIYNGKLEFIENLNSKLVRGDRRDCHLNHLNNKRLADIVENLIKNKTYNINLDLLEKYQWDFRDPSTEERYQKEYEYEKSINNRQFRVYRQSSL